MDVACLLRALRETDSRPGRAWSAVLPTAVEPICFRGVSQPVWRAGRSGGPATTGIPRTTRVQSDGE